MSETTDQMAPEASPDAVSKKVGTRRVNGWPMYILAGGLALIVGFMVLAAMGRGDKQDGSDTQSQATTGNTSMFAQEITKQQTDGMVPPAESLSVPDMPTTLEPETLGPPQMSLGGGVPNPPVANTADVQRIRTMKQQLFEQSIMAKTAVPVTELRSAGSTSGGKLAQPQAHDDGQTRLAAIRQQLEGQRTGDPSAAYHARLAQLRGGAGGDGLSGAQEATSGSRNSTAQFDTNSGDDRWKLNAQPQAPRSPFELRAGFVIPATLISGVNSQLPGQMMAQVSQSVYDTATGKYELIPQGTRLVGTYSSDVAYGQSRVLIAWQRLVFPDGKAMDIGSMPGADSAGYAGFKDKVNNHYIRLFGSAFLMSGVIAGVAMSQDDKDNNRRGNDSADFSSEMSAALGQQLGQVTAELIRKNMNIAPTLEIRPGYRFNVIVTKDLTFSTPYQSFDYAYGGNHS